MDDNRTYVTFEATHNDIDERGNIHYYIDGYTANEDEPGAVIATAILTPANDIVVEWHHNGYRLNKEVLELLRNIEATDIADEIAKRTVQHATPGSLKNAICLGAQDFNSIIHFLFGEDADVDYSLDGIAISDSEDCIDTDVLHTKLAEYFNVGEITSIHIDDADYTGVWIIFKYKR